ncbi:WXG100-like domain-containing protein [Nocardia gipuzkoensis]
MTRTLPPGTIARIESQKIAHEQRDYFTASEALTKVRDRTAKEHNELVGKLNSGLGGMAGTDDAGVQWARTYDEAVTAALQASLGLASTCTRMSNLVAAAAYNHAAAEAATARVAAPEPPIEQPEPFVLMAAHSAAGSAGSAPRLWAWVRDIAALVWPDGDTDRLRRAKEVWHEAADALDIAKIPLTAAVQMLQMQRSPEIPAAVAACGETNAHFLELETVYRLIGDCCGEYAQHLEDARNAILDELENMGWEILAWETGAFLLTPVTAGGSEVAGHLALAARLRAYVLRIGQVIEQLGKAAAIVARACTAVTGRLRALLVKINEWLEKAKTALWRGGKPKPGPLKRGVIDESEKVFNGREKRIADLLADEGKEVKAIKESDVKGQRTYDATVDGVPTEFKSLDPGAGNSAVKNALNSAKGQADHAVIDSRASGLTREEAQRGLSRFLGANPSRMKSVRIVGDSWEINWP